MIGKKKKETIFFWFTIGGKTEDGKSEGRIVWLCTPAAEPVIFTPAFPTLALKGEPGLRKSR